MTRKAAPRKRTRTARDDGGSLARRAISVPRNQRQYEALRRHFVEACSPGEVAAEFGCTEGPFRVLCRHFRRENRCPFALSITSSPSGMRMPQGLKQSVDAVPVARRNHRQTTVAAAVGAARTCRLSRAPVRWRRNPSCSAGAAKTVEPSPPSTASAGQQTASPKTGRIGK